VKKRGGFLSEDGGSRVKPNKREPRPPREPKRSRPVMEVAEVHGGEKVRLSKEEVFGGEGGGGGGGGGGFL